MKIEKKVIVVTGASSGLGLAMATALASHGHIVFGVSRNIRKLKNPPFKIIEMDVTDDQSVIRAMNEIMAQGKIDVLINNAGNNIAGPLYDMSVDTAKRQFEVNFFGVIRVSTAVLPHMIENKQGLLINIGSLAGLFGLPYQGVYSASKYAIEGYSESLRMELINTAIKVVVINPGDFKTGYTDNREKSSFNLNEPELEAEYIAAVKVMERDENLGSNPDQLAAKIVSIVNSSSPSHHYFIGALSQTIVPFLKRILPYFIFVRLLAGHYRIK